ncbi:hypothetical protein HY640_01200 [Candidatus Woesearchaeota archaeon]|nr:hypothetical protein [Candidatus Woesearchaeota archaeon]
MFRNIFQSVLLRIEKAGLVVFLLALMLLLAGCAGRDNSTVLPVQDTFHTGTEGIMIGFLESSPPSELLAPASSGSGYPFKVALRVQNKGAFDVSDGVVAVNVEQDYMSLDSSRKAFSLLGRSFATPVGEEELVIFSGYTRQFRESQAESHDSVVVASSCYKYRTELKSDVCIVSDAFGVSRGPSSCAAKDISSSGQGAPVAVTKVVTKFFPVGAGRDVSSVKPVFELHLKNGGDGRVVSPGADVSSLCSSGPVSAGDSGKVWGYVSVSARLSGARLSCPSVPVRLPPEGAVVRCSLEEPLEAGASYVAPLIVEVDYGYISTVSKQVRILREG